MGNRCSIQQGEENNLIRAKSWKIDCIDCSVISGPPGIYGTAKKKRPGYLVGNLVATNWPIEKALHAIGYNQIPTK